MQKSRPSRRVCEHGRWVKAHVSGASWELLGGGGGGGGAARFRLEGRTWIRILFIFLWNN